MRLTALNPKWIVPPQWSEQSDPLYIGVSFDCPCAKCTAAACPTCGHRPPTQRLAVKFWPPVDKHDVIGRFSFDSETLRSSWCSGAHQRTNGETFDALTLSPSVGFESIGHWHGHINGGEVTTS